jgi:[ribosomal protein S5]-alanine N-acetyltransferase
MNITSQRILLKEITWDDLENIHTLHSCPEVDEYNTLGIPDNIKVTREVIRPAIEDQQKEERKLFCWIIMEKKGKFIGLAGMSLSASRFKMGEIYYKLLPQFWGRGYGTETAKALIKFGFEELQLHRIEAGVATENVKSIRILRKAGMTNEGIRRKILPIRGEWKDNYHFAILEDDERDY